MNKERSHDNFSPDAASRLVAGDAGAWDGIAAELHHSIAECRAEKPILVVECYPGVDELAVLNELASRLSPKLSIPASDAYHSEKKVLELIAPFLNRQNSVSGSLRRLSLVNFFDAEPLWRLRRTIDELKDGLVLIVGSGASLIAWGHLLVYASLVRREARQRFRDRENANRDVENNSLPANLQDQGAFLVDCGIADRWKRPLIKRWDYLLDANDLSKPKLADAEDVRRGLHGVARRPFRLVPFSHSTLEENSLELGFGDLQVEIPAIDLIFNQPQAFLGEAVHRRFGHDFPIPLDFMDKINRFEPFGKGDSWREERATVHGQAATEIRRHWFSKTVTQDTRASVNVVNLFEGDEAIVESPSHNFEPFIVRRAETVIIPATVGRYIIRPHGPSAGKEIATVTAFIKT